MSYTTKTTENTSEMPMNKPNPNPMNKLEQVCYNYLKDVYKSYENYGIMKIGLWIHSYTKLQMIGMVDGIL